MQTKRSGPGTLWVASLIAHALLIGAFAFAPVREYVFEKERRQEPEIIVRDDRLEELMGEVRDRTVQRLQGRLALLSEGQDRMAANFQTINAHVQPFQERQEATAQDRFERYAAQATAQQEAMLALMEKLKSLPKEQWREDLAPASTIASRLLSAQEEIRRGMILLGFETPEEIALQRQAEQAQYAVGQALRDLEQYLAGNVERVARLDQAKGTVDAVRAKVEMHRQQLADHKRNTAAAQAQRDDLERRLAEAEKTFPQLRAEREAASKARSSTEQAANAAKRDMERLQKEFEAWKRKADEEKNEDSARRRDQASAALEEARVKAEEQAKQFASAREAASKLEGETNQAENGLRQLREQARQADGQLRRAANEEKNILSAIERNESALRAHQEGVAKRQEEMEKHVGLLETVIERQRAATAAQRPIIEKVRAKKNTQQEGTEP
jgi:chromosome segregation ATPase